MQLFLRDELKGKTPAYEFDLPEIIGVGAQTKRKPHQVKMISSKFRFTWYWFMLIKLAI